MIGMSYPHMALNAKGVPGWDYQMSRTWSGIEKTTTALEIASRIFANAVTSPGGRLKSVVLNAHGKPGRISLGVGITQENLSNFGILKGVVGEIWIIACSVASKSGTETIKDGQAFCSAFAKTTSAYVFAGVSLQSSYPILPAGYIDDMEGIVFCWDPNGQRISQKDFGLSSIIP